MNIKKMLMAGLTAGLIFGSLAGQVLADTLIQNGSFESGIVSGEYLQVDQGNNFIDNWTVDSGSVDVLRNSSRWPAYDSEQCIDLNGVDPGVISQTFDTISGHQYKVQFVMAGNWEGPPEIKTMTVSVVEDSESYEFNVQGKSGTNMGWETKEFEFTATNESTTLTFTSTTGGGSDYGPILDAVSVEDITPPTPTPIPTDTPTPTPTVMPQEKEECKKDGWEEYGVFNNQGDCVSYIETDGENPPANIGE